MTMTHANRVTPVSPVVPEDGARRSPGPVSGWRARAVLGWAPCRVWGGPVRSVGGRAGAVYPGGLPGTGNNPDPSMVEPGELNFV